MKRYTTLVACSFIMVAFIFSSCDKSDDPPPPTKTELLVRSSWKFKSASAAGIGDVSGQIPACYKDNLHLFVTGGTGNVDESTTVCSPSAAGPFTWNFQANETQLFVSTVLFTGGSQTFNFISVSETELTVSQTVTLPPPLSTSVLVTFIFQH